MKDTAAVNETSDILKLHAIPFLKRPYIPYITPFALYGFCIYIPRFFYIPQYLIYPIKTLLVAASLIYFWNAYKQEIRLTFSWLAVICGVAVFFIWVLPEGLYSQIGYSEFNPYNQIGSNNVVIVIAFRLIGATLVVPLMEEVFWRSFVLRYVIKSDFKSIPLGQFSW